MCLFNYSSGDKMSEENNQHDDGDSFQNLNDLNLSNLWWHSGYDWTSLIKQEIYHEPHQPEKSDAKIQARESKSQKLFFSLLIVLGLLSATMIAQLNQMTQAVQEVGKNLAKEVIDRQQR
jgi:hypothetical protein